MNTTMNTPITVGQVCEIVDDLNGRDRHVCHANVERVTATLIIVRNEHGNIGKFRRKDLCMVGYSWPYLCSALRMK